MKILLTGPNGQLGFELQRALAPLGEVVALDRAACDLSDTAAARAVVRDIAPDLIVNPAAYTAVDKAETDAASAFTVNAEIPAIFAAEARRLGIPLIHYSTDYVFDGSKATAYVEDDATEPQSVYGRSKRDGELAIQASGADALILRTSWVVGAHGGNFAKTMLRLAAQRDRLNVVADQFGAPTSAALLADVTAHLVRQIQRERAAFPFGLYHLTAGGETHWCDYARYVIGAARAAGLPLLASPETVQAITTADYPTPARRPANSRLDTQKFRNTFGLTLPDWRVGVSHVLRQILDRP